MSSLTLKDIPPELLERLREKAKQERRSLSAQAITILQRELLVDYRTPEQRAETSRIWEELAEKYGPSTLDAASIIAARTYGRDIEL